jgi:hypothetical protein
VVPETKPADVAVSMITARLAAKVALLSAVVSLVAGLAGAAIGAYGASRTTSLSLRHDQQARDSDRILTACAEYMSTSAAEIAAYQRARKASIAGQLKEYRLALLSAEDLHTQEVSAGSRLELAASERTWRLTYDMNQYTSLMSDFFFKLQPPPHRLTNSEADEQGDIVVRWFNALGTLIRSCRADAKLVVK